MRGGPAPLLRLARACTVFADGTQVGPLDAEAVGEHLGLVGDFSACFRLLEGRAELLSGSAEVAGVPLREALARGVVGFAPLDPPLPVQLTALAYLEESARLLGRGRAFAQQRARDTVKKFELEHLTRRSLGTLRVAEKRVLVLASAALGAPPVLCCEAPLDRLDDVAAAYVESALERARSGRLSIVSVLSLEPLGRERALLERSDRLLSLDNGEIEAGAPHQLDAAPATELVLTVSAKGDAFAEALSALGLRPTRLGAVDALLALAAPGLHTSFERFLVELPNPELRQQILAASLATGAPLVEMRPARY